MPAPQGKLRAMANSREKGKIDLLDWVSFNEGKLLSRRARKCFQGYELEHAEYSGAVEDSEHTGVYYKFRKPSPAEIGSLIDQFVQSEDSPAAAEKNRAFIHELAGQYFDYPQQYRYASVMHGTGSDAPLLPTLVIRESDLDLSEEELDSHDGSGFSVSTAADLGVGDSLLERFGHLFSFEN